MKKRKSKLYNSKDGYNQVAKQYQKIHSYLDEFEQGKLLSLLGDVKNKKVLDVGAGTGRLTKQLVKLGANLTVLDISEQMLKILQKRIKDNIEIRVGDAENLPMKDNSCDLVLATFLIVHLKSLAKFFSEAYRVLKPKSKFIVTNVNQKEPVPVKIKTGLVSVESYYHRPEEVIGSLKQLGFKIEKDIFVKEDGIWINEIIVGEK